MHKAKILILKIKQDLDKMKKELPIYKLIITEDENDQSEVDFVALVDNPAIKRNWLTFSDKAQMFKTDNERRIITGALMVADMKIYRRNAEFGEHYVIFANSNTYMFNYCRSLTNKLTCFAKNVSFLKKQTCRCGQLSALTCLQHANTR